MQIPKPTKNQMLTAVMAVAVFAVMVFSYAAYPGLGEKNIGGEDWPTETEVTIHIAEGLTATYNGATLAEEQTIIVPYNQDLTILVTIPSTGTMHWAYSTTGYGGGSGSGSEYGHAGATLTVNVMNVWNDTIDVDIWFGA